MLSQSDEAETVSVLKDQWPYILFAKIFIARHEIRQVGKFTLDATLPGTLRGIGKMKSSGTSTRIASRSCSEQCLQILSSASTHF
eukprot:765461-Hanusia_phi.AAC.3